MCHQPITQLRSCCAGPQHVCQASRSATIFRSRPKRGCCRCLSAIRANPAIPQRSCLLNGTAPSLARRARVNRPLRNLAPAMPYTRIVAKTLANQPPRIPMPIGRAKRPIVPCGKTDRLNPKTARATWLAVPDAVDLGQHPCRAVDQPEYRQMFTRVCRWLSYNIGGQQRREFWPT